MVKIKREGEENEQKGNGGFFGFGGSGDKGDKQNNPEGNKGGKGLSIIDNMKKGFGKGVRVLEPNQMGVNDETLYVHPKMKEDLDGIIKAVTDYKSFGEMNYNGILFTGYPGTGKTLTAKYLCYKTNGYFVDLGGELNSKVISGAFSQARGLAQSKQRPVLIFIDEVERLSRRDDIVSPDQGATLSQLLMEMDGTQDNSGVTVLAATNRSDKMDNALRRGGRFDEEIEFLPPDYKGRLHILDIHAYKKRHDFKVKKEDLEEISKVTFGYVGADLRGLLTKAFVRAKTQDRMELKYEDLEYAMKKAKPSAIRDMPFEEPERSLDELRGYAEHRELLGRIFTTSNGARIMFYGPPGNGKTEAAKCCAKSFGCNLIVVAGSAPEDKYVGETQKIIDKYFDRSKALAPTVLLFDEIDALLERKGTMSHKGSWTGLLQSRLSKVIPGVYVIATLNRPDRLRKNLLDRFPDKFYWGMPDKNEQEAIWSLYLPEDIDSKPLMEVNSELTCRDIYNVTDAVKRYNLPQTEDVYKEMIEQLPENQEAENYEEIRNKVGNSVEEYSRVKKVMASLQMKAEESKKGEQEKGEVNGTSNKKKD